MQTSDGFGDQVCEAVHIDRDAAVKVREIELMRCLAVLLLIIGPMHSVAVNAAARESLSPAGEVAVKSFWSNWQKTHGNASFEELEDANKRLIHLINTAHPNLMAIKRLIDERDRLQLIVQKDAFQANRDLLASLPEDDQLIMLKERFPAISPSVIESVKQPDEHRIK